MSIQKIRKLVVVSVILNLVAIIGLFPLQLDLSQATTLTSAPVDQKLLFLLRITIQFTLVVICAWMEYKKPSPLRAWIMLVPILGIGFLDSKVFFNKYVYLHYGIMPLILIGFTIYVIISQHRYSIGLKNMELGPK